MSVNEQEQDELIGSAQGPWTVETQIDVTVPPYGLITNASDEELENLFSESDVRSKMMLLFAIAHEEYLREVDELLRLRLGYHMREHMDSGEYTFVVSGFNIRFRKPTTVQKPTIKTHFSLVKGDNSKFVASQIYSNVECVTEFTCVYLNPNDSRKVKSGSLPPEILQMFSIWRDEGRISDHTDNVKDLTTLCQFNGKEGLFIVEPESLDGLLNTTVINKGLDHVGYSRIFNLLDMGFVFYLKELDEFMKSSYGYSISRYLRNYGYSLMLVESDVQCRRQIFGNDRVSILTKLEGLNTGNHIVEGQESESSLPRSRTKYSLDVMQYIIPTDSVAEVMNKGRLRHERVISCSKLCLVRTKTHELLPIPDELLKILTAFSLSRGQSVA